MTDRISLQVLGVPIDLDVTGLSVAELDAVTDAWADAAAPSPRSLSDARSAETKRPALPAPLTLRVRPDNDTTPLGHLLERLSQRVTLAAIEHRRGNLWMLHAAGLALPDGRVIALIGPSGRGKTTASRALGAHLGYVTDETVGIDVDGRVFAYRKPLSIIEEKGMPKVQRAPSSLGLQPLPDAELRLAAIVLLDRVSDGPDEPVIVPVDLGEALEELVAQSSYLTDMDRPLQRIAALAEQTGGLRRITYREAATLVPALLPLVERSAKRGDDTPPPPSLVERSASGAQTKRPDAPRSLSEARIAQTKRSDPHATDLWFRTPARDTITLTDPDRIAILQADAGETGMLRVIGGIAPVLWRAADGATRDDLVAAAIEAFGEPDGDPGSFVDAALAELADGDLIEQRAPRWAIRDDVAWTGEGDRFVVLSLSDPAGQPQVLEGSAAMIWAALADGAAELGTVCERVAEAAGVAQEVVTADVGRFIAGLSQSALASGI